MAFEGYEIPDEIGVPFMDIAQIENIASGYGESTEQYMLGAIGLVAVWGELIDMVKFTPGMMHGLMDKAAREVELFNIDDLVAQGKETIKLRETVAAEMGLGYEDEGTARFRIPEILKPRIRQACVYFDHGPRPLIGVAAGIREIVISGKNNGLTYAISVDSSNWFDVKFSVIDLGSED